MFSGHLLSYNFFKLVITNIKLVTTILLLPKLKNRSQNIGFQLHHLIFMYIITNKCDTTKLILKRNKNN